ncbi:hypothetical protein DL96DRAFT_1640668 [Flagelloscypha sp. PMI_526]|nr:hypothetical protein DL96DRAFT_1640668 [Flagelloscypha sp. PMI_526]
MSQTTLPNLPLRHVGEVRDYPSSSNSSPDVGSVTAGSNMLVVVGLLASINATLLSHAKDTFSDRAKNGPVQRPTDSVVTTLWLVSMVLSLCTAVLRDPSKHKTPFILTMMRLSVGALIVGILTFAWAEHPLSVSVTLTVVFVCILVGAAFSG